jgi:hypothetical protein
LVLADRAGGDEEDVGAIELAEVEAAAAAVEVEIGGAAATPAL